MSKKCHIVVGGGSSGIILCHKLLERDNVILIERGPSILESLQSHRCFKVLADPSLWYSSRQTNAAVLRTTIPQKHLNGQKILYQQGYGLGGTSNVNAMILTGGHRSVYDLHWPKSWNSDLIDRYL
jgi:choline dehydrogenase